jgi:hypothetical protein
MRESKFDGDVCNAGRSFAWKKKPSNVAIENRVIDTKYTKKLVCNLLLSRTGFC